MTSASHSLCVIRAATLHTSPRLRGEVGARSAPGEGGVPQCQLCKEAPHPNPLPAGGERERTESVVAFIVLARRQREQLVMAARGFGGFAR